LTAILGTSGRQRHRRHDGATRGCARPPWPGRGAGRHAAPRPPAWRRRPARWPLRRLTVMRRRSHDGTAGSWCGHVAADPLGALQRVRRGHPRQDQRHLLASVARHHVGRTVRGPQHPGQGAQRLVAAAMAVAVVESLEVVHVQQHHRHAAAVARGARSLLAQPLVEVPSFLRPVSGSWMDERRAWRARTTITPTAAWRPPASAAAGDLVPAQPGACTSTAAYSAVITPRW